MCATLTASSAVPPHPKKKGAAFFDALDGHRQSKYHSRRKTANALPRSFSVNIYRTLSLSTVLSSIEKRFVRKTFTLCLCYISSLDVFVYELCY